RVTKVMTTLNRKAAEISEKYTVHASTDVTGFGLLGHASEMAKGSNVGIRIFYEQVPILERVQELAESGAVPGGTKNNFAHLEDVVTYPESMNQIERWILCDAVTSGGLLLAVDSEEAGRLAEELRDNEVEAQVIGEVLGENKGRITVQ
ncbi:selenide, water dikinase SelD, partial [Butyricicoccus sp. 1XD8-22]